MTKQSFRWSLVAALVAAVASLTAIGVRAQAQAIKSFAVTASGATAYVINGASNPTLTLAMGQTYTFSVNAPGHPFFIKTARGTSAPNFSTGVTNNGADSGDVVFAVPTAPAPPPLFYQCGVHNAMVGALIIVAPIPAIPAPAVAVLGASVLAVGVLVLRRRRSSRPAA